MSTPDVDPGTRPEQPVLPWRGTTTRHSTSFPEGYAKMVILRGLRLRCPVCGQGKLFRTYFRMYDNCSCCGVGFAREHGQWVGSLDINTFLVAFILMVGVAFGPDWSLPVSLAVYGGAAILVPLATFRFSRGVWTAIVHLTGGVY
jgi:uncharacterized protein (DUF983 family)